MANNCKSLPLNLFVYVCILIINTYYVSTITSVQGNKKNMNKKYSLELSEHNIDIKYSNFLSCFY